MLTESFDKARFRNFVLEPLNEFDDRLQIPLFPITEND